MPITQFRTLIILINKRFTLLSSIGLLALLGYLFIRLFTHVSIAQEPQVADNLRLEEFACVARDPQSFKSCIDEARKNAVPVIKIIAPIICTTAADCSFQINNLHSSLTILSSHPENKFLRQGDFSYSLLTISNSSNLSLDRLVFEDEGDSGCPQGLVCPPLTVIHSSGDLHLSKLTFLSSKGTSLEINNSRDISLDNSSFINSFKTGIEVKTEGFTQNIKILSNSFENNSGSALIFQALGAGSDSSIISGNKFINNHSNGSFRDCLYPCVAPQLKIKGPSSNIRITENTISGGANTALDSLGLFASGIELSGQSVSNTTIFCNEIASNRGSGIVQSPPFSNISGIRITENRLWNNGLNLNVPTATTSADNCYTSDCTLSCK